MNKKKFILFLIVATTILSTFLFITNKNKVEITNTINNKIKNNRGLLTMNLEQTAGVGDYKQVTQSNWPTEVYKFYYELSKHQSSYFTCLNSRYSIYYRKRKYVLVYKKCCQKNSFRFPYGRCLAS